MKVKMIYTTQKQESYELFMDMDLHNGLHDLLCILIVFFMWSVVFM